MDAERQSSSRIACALLAAGWLALSPPAGGAEPGPAAAEPATSMVPGEEQDAPAPRSAERLRRQLAEAVAEAKLALAESAGPRPGDELTARRRELEELVERGEGVAPEAPPAEIEELQRELVLATVRLQQQVGLAPPRPGAPLQAAAGAYFRGQYRLALGLLSAGGFADSAEEAQARLFAAASRHALHRRSGGTDAALLARAREDAAACRRLAPELEPDPAAFSPAFLAFFRQAGASP